MTWIFITVIEIAAVILTNYAISEKNKKERR